MRTNLSVLCRIVGQLGILTSAAATLAPYTTMLPDLGELVAIAPPTLLAHGLADLLFVPAALLVCWASAQPWRGRLALGGCGVLACLLICQLALLQAMTGLNNLWGAGYLLATVIFPLGSVALLAASHHQHRHQYRQLSGVDRHPALGLGRPRLVPIVLGLTVVSILAVWSGRLPSIVEISVVAACALYAIHSWVQPFAMAWVPVAAMLTALAALQDELSLLALALGPVPMINDYESVTAAISGLTALTLAAVWGLRAHRTRHPATDPECDLESDPASRL